MPLQPAEGRRHPGRVASLMGLVLIEADLGVDPGEQRPGGHGHQCGPRASPVTHHEPERQRSEGQEACASWESTKSYQLSEVNTVAPLKYIGVIFALTWDIVLFDFIPNGQMFLGIALVIGGVVLNLRFKARLKRSHTHTEG